MRTRSILATGAAALVLTVGAAPFLVSGADHLDAPSLGSLSAGSLQGDRDINDVYAFEGANRGKTVIAVTTNPAAGLLSMPVYGTNVRYRINVDNSGDAEPDVVWEARFQAPGSGPDGKQAYTLKRNGTTVATGSTGNTVQVSGGGKVFAGLRSDPFFFDLLGFRGSLGLGGTETLCDSDPSDFFANLNTMAIVLEVPDGRLDTDNGQVGIWATTDQWIDGAWVRRDQMGRPAINTVFNSTGAHKELFNATDPADQNDPALPFHDNIAAVLEAFGYAPATADAIANFLLPDVVTYDVDTVANGEAFNGRALDDDVIDAELAVTTMGAVPSDCVGPHGDYQSTFPYLGAPH